MSFENAVFFCLSVLNTLNFDMAQALPIKGALGTILFMMMFVVLFLVTYFFGDSKTPVFYFLVVLTLFMFIAVLMCIENIQAYTKMTEEWEKQTNQDVVLTSCPQYWTKQYAIDPATKKKHTFCNNKIEPDMYVSGSVDNMNNAYLNKSLTDLRADATYPVVETDTPIDRSSADSSAAVVNASP
jgi:hypothetical protein